MSRGNSFSNGSITIRKGSRGEYRRWIKINGRWIINSRYVYEQSYRLLRPGEDVHHKNEDTLNDDPNNLEAKIKGKHISIHKKGIPLSEQHKRNVSLSLTGEKGAGSKLTSKEVKEIKHRYWWTKNISQYKLANLYGVLRTCIRSILNGHRWNPNNLTKKQLIKKSRILRTPING